MTDVVDVVNMSAPEPQGEKRPTMLRRVIGYLLIVVVFFGAVGYTWRLAATSGRTEDIVRARTEGRITTCVSDRRFELAHNKLVQTQQNNTTKLFADTAAVKPEDQRAGIIAYGAAQNVELEATKVPVRACDAASIDAYYVNPQPPDGVPCDPDGTGFCRP